MTHYIDRFPGRKIRVGKKNYLYFGGTSYLGLQTDARFQKLLINNIIKYGTNYGASRISNVRWSIYEKSENYLAHLVGSESCISLSSGYLAGQFVRQYFNNTSHKTFYTANSHAALQLPNDKVESSHETLKMAIEEHLHKTNAITPVVFLDSIDFSGRHYPHFNDLKTLPLDKIIVVVDDSHGIGIVGKNGRGVYKSLLELGAKELVVCSSLGKGFGLQVGAVFGTTEMISSMRETDFYGGASPATPAHMATLLESGVLMEEKRMKLQKRIKQFKKRLPSHHGFSMMDGHPAFSFSDKVLTDYLEKQNIIVTNFSYPSEDSSTMSRIVISSAHKKNDIKKLTGLIKRYYSQ
ncbi:aminotransferase class I/II-fold pyridoxal phosphate-dependent enzyme [Sediminicola sp. 1XM1-17]|uniref:aminotransferase class I/II-fold pyridoxal phosphate-dependent enzyme n=1 Tax=Sediminicola sp. 1XM1-17 TaxID=3127702 RepID=UPI00307770DC